MSELIDELRRQARLPSPPLRRAIRETAGASQDQVARALGVHRVSLWRWEQGRRTPRGAIRERYVLLLEELRRMVDDDPQA
jgi:DNA-binding transcriptional regulator YiaG